MVRHAQTQGLARALQLMTLAMKFSLNMPPDIGVLVRGIGLTERLSDSSIVEVALRDLFERVPPERMEGYLKELGACLRRS